MPQSAVGPSWAEPPFASQAVDRFQRGSAAMAGGKRPRRGPRPPLAWLPMRFAGRVRRTSPLPEHPLCESRRRAGTTASRKIRFTVERRLPRFARPERRTAREGGRQRRVSELSPAHHAKPEDGQQPIGVVTRVGEATAPSGSPCWTAPGPNEPFKLARREEAEGRSRGLAATCGPRLSRHAGCCIGSAETT